ncbi:MAG: hypothetical protein EBZ48_05090 [Proteobacteria bacterium]|nr:hypothetical protein [Pseudomonadota bacterium]
MSRHVLAAFLSLVISITASSAAWAQSIRQLADINTNPAMLRIFAGCSGAGIRVVLAQTSQYGIEPFVTDGTTTGTRLLKDTLPGPEGSTKYFRGCVALSGKLYFVLRGQLWRTDGTTGGTSAIVTQNPGDWIEMLVGYNGRLYFLKHVLANYNLSGVYSIRADGADSKFIFAGSAQGLIAAADGVYFLENNYDFAQQSYTVKIRRTQGTPGTTAVMGAA